MGGLDELRLHRTTLGHKVGSNVQQIPIEARRGFEQLDVCAIAVKVTVLHSLHHVRHHHDRALEVETRHPQRHHARWCVARLAVDDDPVTDARRDLHGHSSLELLQRCTLL